MPEVTIHEAVQVDGKVYPEGVHTLSDTAVESLRRNGRGHLITVADEPKAANRKAKPAKGEESRPAEGDENDTGSEPKEA